MPRDEKIRDRLFPGAEPFRPELGGYAAIPFILRRVQWLFDPRAWQIYTYIVMRLGPAGVGWLTFAELSWDLDFKSQPKLRAYVNKLVDDGWLLHRSSRAREYFFAPNPVDVVRRKARTMPPDRREAVEEVLESLEWEGVEAAPAASTMPRRGPRAAARVSPVNE